MTILERVNAVMQSDVDLNDETPSVEKLIYMAYAIAFERAVKEVSDAYAQHIAQQHKRASECRYKHMAENIVGPERYLYNPAYSAPFTETFGSDPADI